MVQLEFYNAIGTDGISQKCIKLIIINHIYNPILKISHFQILENVKTLFLFFNLIKTIILPIIVQLEYCHIFLKTWSA